MLKILEKFTKNCLFKRYYSEISNNEIEILKNEILKECMEEEDKKDFEKPKLWSLYRSTPQTFDQSFSNVFLFPGQGTQFLGMGKDLIKLPQVQRIFESASEYLNYNLLKVCMEGPSEKLDKTIHCQPAIYVMSIAALEKIKEEEPQLIENCIATAGQSLGEITSLVFAGALTFEAGLHFIRVRAEVMERACLNNKGGLMSIFLGPQSQLTKAMDTAKQYCYEKLHIQDPICQVSTYLFTECKVIGGNLEALDFIETFAKDFKLRGTKRLNVQGAFHTPMMKEAQKPCYNTLKRIGLINNPKIPVLSNVTGTIHTTTSEIRRLLVKQLCFPVMWEQILMRMYMRPLTCGFPTTIEIGPGSSLGLTVKRVNKIAFEKYRNIKI